MLDRGKPSARGTTSILPFTLVSPSSPLMLQHLWPLSLNHQLLLFCHNTSTFTPGSLFISCLRTRPGSHIVSNSFLQEWLGKQRNENERFGVAQKGQLWLKSLPFLLSSLRFTYTRVLAIFPKETSTISVSFRHPFGIFVAVEVIRKLYDFKIASLRKRRGNRVIKKEFVLKILF